MHRRQREFPARVASAWQAALADAGIAPECALLYLMPGKQSSDGYGGWHGPRGFGLRNGNGLPGEIREILGEVDSEDAIDAHRIFVWEERTEEGLAAAIRHELEHAVQYDRLGMGLQELAALAYAVIGERVGGLPGGGFLYQAIPVEMDANAAAAMFARARYGDERINQFLAEGDDDGASFRSRVSPGPLETLSTRMLLFLASMRDLCEWHAERQACPSANSSTFAGTAQARSGNAW